MNLVIPIIIAIFISCLPAFSQSASSKCPKLIVIGPAGISNPGDRIIFALELVGDVPAEKSVRWTVNRGEIVEGQGTLVLVVVSKLFGANVEATATLEGLAQECNNSATESAPTMQKIEGQPVDEYGNLPNDDQRGRLDLFFSELANNPSNKGFIVVSSSKRNDKREAMRRIAFVLNHVRFRRFDKSRLIFGIEYGGGPATVLWRVPPGAEFPCSNCEIIRNPK